MSAAPDNAGGIEVERGEVEQPRGRDEVEEAGAVGGVGSRRAEVERRSA